MRPSKIIYITGIPYDKTEEQVLDIASSVGPVVSSKLLFDKDTGKSKGTCLVEYQDIETASSAVRNLNNYSISSDNGKGGRYLKCSFGSQDSILRLLQGDAWSGGGGYRSSPEQASKYELEREIPPLPAGMNVGDSSMDGLNATIYQALTRMDRSRLQNLVRDAQLMSQGNSKLMQLLLNRNPQLVYALVQSALLLNITSPDRIKDLLVDQEEAKLNSKLNSKPNSKTTVPVAPMVPVASTDPPNHTLTPQQLEAIRAICSMSDDQITQQIADTQQQQLYLEIKRKYSGLS
ncbi:hypothetical protein FOA43_002819 [Brettanomyces nanus]|uniref:RRM domain-containing protein n=1 Tax=Eeniella nana TaxID=13502 RepID=A0A875S8P6_EENNA|nr:uncharacterized protein FOA43_002819 [Brettanomyces nanus]QPG75464.1 hypothetical protein FOA43_002819 [Brettanomyces nanus]